MSLQTTGNSGRKLDWASVAIFLSLFTIGWLMLYSIFREDDNTLNFLDFSTQIGKQTIWVGICLLAFIIVLNIDWKFWNTLAYPIYGVSVILLILVLIIGSEIKGAKSWFAFGGASFQPSEVAKFGTALALSSYLSVKKVMFSDRKVLATIFVLIFTPVFLILLQSDPGSALVFFSFFILLYRKGLSPQLYFLAFVLLSIFIFTFIFGSPFVLVGVGFVSLAILLFNYRKDLIAGLGFLLVLLSSFVFYNRGIDVGVFAVPYLGILILMFLHFKERNLRLLSLTSLFLVLSLVFSFGTSYAFNNYLKPHQQDRINVWLSPEKCDPSGPLYNLIQSKLAIGSGGLIGKGYMNGEMTKLKYVPAQSTDFVFSSVGEEQGFVGVIGVIILFSLLVWRLIYMAERARLEFIRNYLYCVAGIIFIHFFINIGMTMGLMPVIGIPLPLMSKGGSSLLAFTIMIGVAIKMDSYHTR